MGMKDFRERHRHDASFEGVYITGGMLKQGLKKWPVAQCEVTLDNGAGVSARMTATRVLGGAVLLGPLGAVLGGLAKKDRTKIYVGIAVPGDAILLEVKPKKEKEAREFVAKMNAAIEQFKTREEAPTEAP